MYERERRQRWTGLRRRPPSRVLGAILVLGCQGGASESQAQAQEGRRTMDFPRIGLRFAVPDGFLVGRFDASSGIDEPFREAVVLVEPDQLANFDLEAVPVGDIPALWVNRPASTSVAGRYIEADSIFTVPVGQVARYPGYPGPYGDQAFYYVVEVGEGAFVEIMAHRTLFRSGDGTSPSHYDEAILAILESLEVIP